MKDIVGQKFGRLTILGPGRIVKGNRKVKVLCDCGKESVAFLTGLRTGRIKSCGCFGREVAAEMCRKRNTTHGASGTREYRIYKNILTRCLNARFPAYRSYGGRGITVCKQWQGKLGFEHFLEDMGKAPTDRHTIDRIDNQKGYSPDNCRWATRAEQSRNTRRSRMLSHNGETLCLKDWAKRYGIGVYAFMSRLIFDGWPE